MLVVNTELLSLARQYKAELMTRMFGIVAQAAGRETEPAIESLPLNSNVIGMGFGLRAMNNSSPQKERALRVYVHEKLPQSSLSSTEIVPLAINGLATDVIPIGDIVALSRPTKCGVSVGHYLVSAGTLGCLVKRANAMNDERYILSNNHVLANCNDANIGDLILHPGSTDGGNLLNPIAVLTEFEELQAAGSGVNRMDAAIAKILNYDEVLPEIIQIGAIKKSGVIATPEDILDLQVCKYGRTTKHTLGTIGDIAADFNVSYPNNMRAYFVEQIGIDWLDKPFSEGGDSGSLIVDHINQQPVALLFAAGKKQSFATPINQILTRFQIEIL